MTLNNNTILRRQGNKGNLLQPLFRAFPDMVTLIEPFAGTLAVSLHALRTGRAEKCIELTPTCVQVAHSHDNLYSAIDF